MSMLITLLSMGIAIAPDYYNRKRGDREQKMTLDEWIEKGYDNN